MITRRAVFVLVLSSAACRSPGEKIEILPMTLGEWRRLSVEDIPPEEHSEELKRRGIKRARRGTYHVPGQEGRRMIVSIHQFGASAVAFELVQKWKPEPRAIAFHQGSYFVILKSGRDDNKEMNGFASQLEAVLLR